MTEDRRTFLKHAGWVTAGLPFLSWGGCATLPLESRHKRPNIVLILTDDQGYGDLSCTGNPVLKTPNMDRIFREGAQFTNFHVSPVCSPTRSSLLTGRYNYRTGVVDTYQGRSMMHPDEVTIAEMLAEGGYRTGIFGKWHLGDNYPLRAMDQGFQESLVHKGGGICQPSEPGNTSYFNPLLKKNGQDVRVPGYCTDVFTDAAIAFIEQNSAAPFFCYLATNAPHDPLQIEDRYWKPFAEQGLEEKTARVYGMIKNLDENIGRILSALDRLGITENTVVIFLTDNGPAYGGAERYNAGLRGQKGTVYEGGIRVPCFMRWPGKIKPEAKIDTLSAHIDMTPTLLEICRCAAPEQVRFDGRSLFPLLSDNAAPWTDRALFFQWHRGDVPEAFNNCAVLSGSYKLVDGKELYNLLQDPGEKNDISAEHKETVRALRKAYEQWFLDVGNTRKFAPPRIVLGAPEENPSVLTRQDWRGSKSWHDGQVGWWEVQAVAGQYQISCVFPEAAAAGEAVFRLNGVMQRQPFPAGATTVSFPAAQIPSGEGRLEVWAETGGAATGPQIVYVRY